VQTHSGFDGVNVAVGPIAQVVSNLIFGDSELHGRIAKQDQKRRLGGIGHFDVSVDPVGKEAPASRRWQGPAAILLALFNLDDFVGDEAMGFAMDSLGRFLARGLTQAEDGSIGFVEPIFQVFHPVFLLDLQILLVDSGDSFSRQAINSFVNIHID